MSNRVNFLRRFYEAYNNVKIINDVQVLPIYASLEATILAADYTSSSAESVKLFYENTHLTDIKLSEIYYDHLPRPKNLKFIGDKIKPTSVRSKRKVISDALYDVFGDDFFTVLLTEKNYPEVNWRRNIVNHKLGNMDRLFSSEAITAIGSFITRAESSSAVSDNSNKVIQNDSTFIADSVGFNQATTGAYSLSECEKELEFLHRYLNPELALADEKLNPQKLAHLLTIMSGTSSDTSTGGKLDVLGEILGRTESFSRP